MHSAGEGGIPFRDRFAPTCVYAREDPEFHTRLCVYNYFSEIFSETKTGATVFLTFYDTVGQQVDQRAVEIGYRGQLQFDLSELGIHFEGIAAVAMVPEAMPKLPHNRQIATGYYVFYYDEKGNADMGHDWEPIKTRPSRSGYWLQTVRPQDNLRTDIIVMSCYFGLEEEAGQADWALRLRDRRGQVVAERKMPLIPARGIARIDLEQVFPDVASLAERAGTLSAEVTGQNIQGPLTLVHAPNGDFNIHHF